MALRAGSVGLGSEAGGREVGWWMLTSSPRGSGRLKPDRGALARGWAQLGPLSGGSLGRQLTADLELERTRGIRLFN